MLKFHFTGAGAGCRRLFPLIIVTLCLAISPAVAQKDSPDYSASGASWDSDFASAVSDFNAGRLSEAGRKLESVYSRNARLPAGDSRKTKSAIALADLYRVTRRPREAEPLYKEAISQEEERNNPCGAAMCMNKLAGLYKDESRYQEAEALYRKATAYLEKRGPRISGDKARIASGLVLTTANLALLYQKMGRLDDAEKAGEKALKRSISGNPGSVEAAQCFQDLASVKLQLHKFSEAAENFEKALAIYKRELAPDDLRIATCSDGLGSAEYAIGAYSEAERMARQALVIYEKKLPPASMELAVTYSNLGHRLLRQRKPEDATTYLRRSLGIQEKRLGKDSPESIANLHGIAEAHAMKGELPASERLLRRILAIKERSDGGNSPTLIPCLVNLGNCVQQQPGRQADAETIIRRADSLKALVPPTRRKQIEALMRNEMIPSLTRVAQDSMRQSGI